MDQQLPGIVPLATATLRAYVMPDGSISHFEVEGRGPDDTLLFLRAQASQTGRPSDESYTSSVEFHLKQLWAAYETGRLDREAPKAGRST